MPINVLHMRRPVLCHFLLQTSFSLVPLFSILGSVTGYHLTVANVRFLFLPLFFLLHPTQMCVIHTFEKETLLKLSYFEYTHVDSNPIVSHCIPLFFNGILMDIIINHCTLLPMWEISS